MELVAASVGHPQAVHKLEAAAPLVQFASMLVSAVASILRRGAVLRMQESAVPDPPARNSAQPEAVVRPTWYYLDAQILGMTGAPLDPVARPTQNTAVHIPDTHCAVESPVDPILQEAAVHRAIQEVHKPSEPALQKSVLFPARGSSLKEAGHVLWKLAASPEPGYAT